MAKHLEIKKLAIANRGEVAVRIIRACQEMGISTVLLHSEADTKSMAARLADECVRIGDSPSSESYLNIQANVDGTIRAGADAVHPGFGFLSENADFARACEKAHLIFVGPTAESIELFGDKISAKNLVERIGGPLIPGYSGHDQRWETIRDKAEEIGFPVIIKAAGGGGGRGLKVVRKKDEVQQAVESAAREGLNAFGSSHIFVEKYLDHAKHVEVQIFGDASGKIHHLLERECSVQRRHQKIIEEATAAALDFELRDRLIASAIEIAKSANYRGAGTVEFLVQDGAYYFMEMNTRLQVEHPVTEMVTSRDLVKAQILTAMGKPVPWMEEATPRGHAIECRLYAENPYMGGIPSTGVLGACHFPQGPFRRFEVGFEEGDEVTAYYDSMIAKIVVWDESRVRAIQKLKKVLDETVIFGLYTNIPLLKKIISHPEFVDGSMTTRFFETHFSQPLDAPAIENETLELAKQLDAKIAAAPVFGASGSAADSASEAPSPWYHSWGRL